MIADARGMPYHAVHSLDEARDFPDAVVILEGDDGGQVYVACPASRVRCSEAVLQQLLSDLDACEWDDLASARVFFERIPMGADIGGGMGGGKIMDGVWVHDRLAQMGLGTLITDVIEGRRARITDEPLG